MSVHVVSCTIPAIGPALLWTAPEVLRGGQPGLQGNQRADVYSFAIIMQEVIMRGLPYCMLDFTASGDPGCSHVTMRLWGQGVAGDCRLKASVCFFRNASECVGNCWVLLGFLGCFLFAPPPSSAIG